MLLDFSTSDPVSHTDLGCYRNPVVTHIAKNAKA